MHIHILGICGTFMGSLAVLAKELGHRVSGSDANVYPPMSTQLESQGITLCQGYQTDHLQPAPDLVVIGNAMARGNPVVEYVLDRNLNYCSGPEYLARYLLRDRWVMGVAGTHGKTTTSAMLAWILQFAGLAPGYLIGGVAGNFASSATVGKPPFFVVEADEYDTAFFDKRSKFIHYTPRTAILNNLEFDHGDIFENLEAIKKQFHHLVRTIPSNGLILYSKGERHIDEVLDMGCWTPVQQYGVAVPRAECEGQASRDGIFWNAGLRKGDGSQFTVEKYTHTDAGCQVSAVDVEWGMTGRHNVTNGLAAIAAAHHGGVALNSAGEALSQFAGVKRRMELRGEVRGIKVYDDFAHHPTAIATTLEGMAAKLQAGQEQQEQQELQKHQKQRDRQSDSTRLIAVIEPRSNTMRMGVHQAQLAAATGKAAITFWKRPAEAGLDLDRIAAESSGHGRVCDSVDEIVQALVQQTRAGDHVVIMSNGGFEGIHEKLLEALRTTDGPAG